VRASLSRCKAPSNGVEFVALCRAVRERMPAARYRHVLGVARAAEKLAARHGASPHGARIAGIVHDIARHWPPEELLAYARKHGMDVSPVERAEPVLLHARVAAEIAHTDFGIDDPEVLAAIASHTVARPRMSVLEKCVYVADSVEPSRTFADRAVLAELAERDLDAGFFAALQSSIRHLTRVGVPIAPETVEVYNEMVSHAEQA
jgi:predicted HD superfamily hydrolase involved in NAD metabolism